MPPGKRLSWKRRAAGWGSVFNPSFLPADYLFRLDGNTACLSFRFCGDSEGQDQCRYASHLSLCESSVWGYAAKTNINKLDTLQNSLIRQPITYPASNQRAASKLSVMPKTLNISHPDEARLPDSIDQPITAMPLSRMKKPTFAKSHI
ncbi:hypothetical protein TNCV_5062511 [Trichonephila clavipes]|nr:hypothetical protein TNCV_5062511 [Trichonephila clavipes]